MSEILITTSSFNLNSPEIKVLRAAGYEITLNPYGRRLTEDEIKGLLTPEIVGMIAGVEPLTRDVLGSAGASSLRVISRCGIGMDSVDQDAAAERGITVCNTPDAPTRAVAELALALILDLLRKVSFQDRTMRAGGWERPMGGLLGARTLGLVGFGRIGRKVADYAQAFGAEIIFYDPLAPTEDSRSRSLADLLAQADIVSLHIPYNAENHHLIGAEQLSQMKKGAYLVNTARGGLVDEAALLEALKGDALAGAALDVFEKEPYTGALKDLDNIVLSAHVGSYAAEARSEQEALAAVNLLNALSTEQKDGTHG